MNLDDSEVYPIMATKVRNPYPLKVVFKQCNDVLKKQTYQRWFDCCCKKW